MNLIDFSIKNKNLYHTLQEQNVFLIDNKKTGEAIITGWTHEEIIGGTRFYINNQYYEVIAVLERRDHKGVFENPEDKVNTYFKVITKF